MSDNDQSGSDADRPADGAGWEAAYETVEMSFEMDVEAPVRDFRGLFGVGGSIHIESDSPAADGEYRWCAHCDGALVEESHLEDHIREEHGLEP